MTVANERDEREAGVARPWRIHRYLSRTISVARSIYRRYETKCDRKDELLAY
jgi:hypothetical protein